MQSNKCITAGEVGYIWKSIWSGNYLVGKGWLTGINQWKDYMPLMIVSNHGTHLISTNRNNDGMYAGVPFVDYTDGITYALCFETSYDGNNYDYTRLNFWIADIYGSGTTNVAMHILNIFQLTPTANI